MASRFVLSEEKARNVVAFVLEAARDDISGMAERLRRKEAVLDVTVIVDRLGYAVERVRLA